jgi:hypothetical protein
MDELIQKKPSGRGGARPGAGRKPGSVTKKTRAIAERVAATGMTPLEVMIEAMNEAYDKGGPAAAFSFARDAAPYMHPKVSAIEMTGKDGKPLIPEAPRKRSDFYSDD